MPNIRSIVENDGSITEFQRKVYLALLDVPRGATISYKQLGERIGCRSAQAIGQALKRNPFAPDVPCHRVIASNGSLGGFHGQRDGEIAPTAGEREEINQQLIHRLGGSQPQRPSAQADNFRIFILRIRELASVSLC